MKRQDFNPKDINVRCRVCNKVKFRKEFDNIIWRICNDCCKEKSLKIKNQNLLTKKLCFFNIKGNCCLNNKSCNENNIRKKNCPNLIIIPKEDFIKVK